MPHDVAVLELTDVADGVATFEAEFTGKKLAQRYYLWLSLNDVLEVGDKNPDAFAPINQWEVPDGKTSPVSIPVVAGHSYEAYVSLFPDVWTPVSNVVAFTA